MGDKSLFDHMKKQEIEEDDGHVIANMNVEGMPWYRKEEKWHEKGKKDAKYSKEETRYIIWGTLKAALLIAGAFIGGLFLFILLLCIVGWIRY